MHGFCNTITGNIKSFKTTFQKKKKVKPTAHLRAVIQNFLFKAFKPFLNRWVVQSEGQKVRERLFPAEALDQNLDTCYS